MGGHTFTPSSKANANSAGKDSKNSPKSKQIQQSIEMNAWFKETDSIYQFASRDILLERHAISVNNKKQQQKKQASQKITIDSGNTYHYNLNDHHSVQDIQVNKLGDQHGQSSSSPIKSITISETTKDQLGKDPVITNDGKTLQIEMTITPEQLKKLTEQLGSQHSGTPEQLRQLTEQIYSQNSHLTTDTKKIKHQQTANQPSSKAQAQQKKYEEIIFNAHSANERYLEESRQQIYGTKSAQSRSSKSQTKTQNNNNQYQSDSDEDDEYVQNMHELRDKYLNPELQTQDGKSRKTGLTENDYLTVHHMKKQKYDQDQLSVSEMERDLTFLMSFNQSSEFQLLSNSLMQIENKTSNIDPQVQAELRTALLNYKSSILQLVHQCDISSAKLLKSGVITQHQSFLIHQILVRSSTLIGDFGSLPNNATIDSNKQSSSEKSKENVILLQALNKKEVPLKVSAAFIAIMSILAVNMVLAQKFSKHQAPVPLLTLVAAIANAGAMTFQAVGWVKMCIFTHWISDVLAYNVYQQIYCHVLGWWYNTNDDINSNNNSSGLSQKSSDSKTAPYEISFPLVVLQSQCVELLNAQDDFDPSGKQLLPPPPTYISYTDDPHKDQHNLKLTIIFSLLCSLVQFQLSLGFTSPLNWLPMNLYAGVLVYHWIKYVQLLNTIKKNIEQKKIDQKYPHQAQMAIITNQISKQSQNSNGVDLWNLRSLTGFTMASSLFCVTLFSAANRFTMYSENNSYCKVFSLFSVGVVYILHMSQKLVDIAVDIGHIPIPQAGENKKYDTNLQAPLGFLFDSQFLYLYDLKYNVLGLNPPKPETPNKPFQINTGQYLANVQINQHKTKDGNQQIRINVSKENLPKGEKGQKQIEPVKEDPNEANEDISLINQQLGLFHFEYTITTLLSLFNLYLILVGLSMSRPLTFVDPPSSKNPYGEQNYDYGLVFLGLYGQYELTWELLGFCDLKWVQRYAIYTSSFTRTFFYLKVYLDLRGYGQFLFNEHQGWNEKIQAHYGNASMSVNGLDQVLGPAESKPQSKSNDKKLVPKNGAIENNSNTVKATASDDDKKKQFKLGLTFKSKAESYVFYIHYVIKVCILAGIIYYVNYPEANN